MRRLILLAALGILPSPMIAQTVTTCTIIGATGKCSPNVMLDKPATMVNPAIMDLTFSSTAFSITADVTDIGLDDGMSAGSTVAVTVRANRAWSVQVKGNSAFWTASTGAWSAKPVSDLHWSLTPIGASAALSQTSATMLSNSAGASTTTVYIRPVMHWLTDKPGTYSLGLTFTLTTP